MKRALVIAISIALSSGAVAQTPPASPRPEMPAANSPANMPAKGANSFTQAQAKSRIEGMGFTNVTGLEKDKDGVWRGKAMKAGASHDVAVDYKGNVFPH